MNTAQPIRRTKDLEQLKAFYREKQPNARNYLLIIVGLNTALRISDILELRWGELYDFEQGNVLEHLALTEQKTGKRTCIYLNRNIAQALESYYEELSAQGKAPSKEGYLFEGQGNRNKPISRVQAHRIVKKAAEGCQIEGAISCHSLRKTFGYQAWKQGVSPVMLMNIYNHSSFQVTKRYLGIEQDDRDQVFREIII